MNDAITAGMPTVKKNGMIGMNPPIAVEIDAESVDRSGLGNSPRTIPAPRGPACGGTVWLLLNALGHRARFCGREPLQLIEQLELEHFFVRVFFDCSALPRDFRLVDLALRLRGEVRAGAHGQRARQRAGQPRGQYHFAAARVACHARHDAEYGAEPVVDAVDRVADPTRSADVPPLPTQNRFERRSRRRH
jgi:hypothetical protein